MVRRLNKEGIDNILIVDSVGKSEKWENLVGCKFYDIVAPHDIEPRAWEIPEAVIHLGGIANTEEQDFDYLLRQNYRSSQLWWRHCHDKSSLFIYASSAATYGNDSRFDDSNLNLIPTTRYGYSKHLFDLWAIRQEQTPAFWYGLKIFNAYGAYEAHKGRQASVHHKWLIEATRCGLAHIEEKQRCSTIGIYKDPREGKSQTTTAKEKMQKADGEATRDFIYVGDVCGMIWTIIERAKHGSQIKSGIYNIGTGKARSYNEVANAVFSALGPEGKIIYEDMPESLRKGYQYHTEANMKKTNSAFGRTRYTPLESGVKKLMTHMKKAGEI